MPIYTVHQPPQRQGAGLDPERFAFVRDGFYLRAFLFGPLWMLLHRLWLVLVGYLVLAAGLEFVLRLVKAPWIAEFVVLLLLALLVGLEAGDLRRWTLTRRGWVTLGLVAGEDEESAERRFYDQWAARGELPAAAAVPLPPAQWRPPGNDVIGLFPDSGAGQPR